MDLTPHRLVPKHGKVSDSEKTAILKEYQVQLKDLPKIMRKDQALARLNVKAGDIIRVERESKTAGRSYYYRVVVDG